MAPVIISSSASKVFEFCSLELFFWCKIRNKVDFFHLCWYNHLCLRYIIYSQISQKLIVLGKLFYFFQGEWDITCRFYSCPDSTFFTNTGIWVKNLLFSLLWIFSQLQFEDWDISIPDGTLGSNFTFDVSLLS